MVKKAKTKEELDAEFDEQARAFRNGTRKELPDLLLGLVFIDKKALPPPPPANPTAAQLRAQVRVERVKQLFINLLFRTADIRRDEPDSYEMLLRFVVEKILLQTTETPPPKPVGAPPLRGRYFEAIVIAAFNEARVRLAKAANKRWDQIPVRKVEHKHLDQRYRDLLQTSGKKPRPLKIGYLRKVYSVAMTDLRELGQRYKNSEPR
jgi:hypothetical protein